jgi:hypothetical protein
MVYNKKKKRKKPAEPEPEEYADWYPRKMAARGKDPHWVGKMTPAERRQFDAEADFASRAFREDVPGPRRLTVIED